MQWGSQFGGDTLRGETKERWRELCERAIVERDPDRFVDIIQELLQVLEQERKENKMPESRDRVRLPLTEKPTHMSCPVP